MAEGHPLIDALLLRAPAALAGADRGIHRDDEMLGHALAMQGGDLDAALVDYFREGLQVASVVRQVATWRWGSLDRIGAMLDFASGCGRVTRFLVREIPAERIAVSDVLPAAIAFQAERFGVRAVPSSADAERFDPSARYDLIWATSLFTHLPAAAFEAWLRRLLGCLTPDGLLAFSVHDPSVLRPALRPEDEMPAGGFLFRAHSESRTLDPEAYGSSFASEAFVRAALERAQPGVWCRRLPRALSNFQDLYLAAAYQPPLPDPSVDAGPVGHLDLCAVPEPGQIEFGGWAAQWTGGFDADGAERVVVRLDGVEVGSVRPSMPRPDVDAAHRRPGARGFAVRCAVPPALRWDAAVLEVAAISAGGVATPIFLGSLRAAQAASVATQAANARAALAEREGWFAHVEPSSKAWSPSARHASRRWAGAVSGAPAWRGLGSSAGSG